MFVAERNLLKIHGLDAIQTQVLLGAVAQAQLD